MIDQLLYEKYSGRHGNTQDRLGLALAAFAAQQQRDHAVLDIPLSQRCFNAMAVSMLICFCCLLGALLVLATW